MESEEDKEARDSFKQVQFMTRYRQVQEDDSVWCACACLSTERFSGTNLDRMHVCVTLPKDVHRVRKIQISAMAHDQVCPHYSATKTLQTNEPRWSPLPFNRCLIATRTSSVYTDEIGEMRTEKKKNDLLNEEIIKIYKSMQKNVESKIIAHCEDEPEEDL